MRQPRIADANDSTMKTPITDRNSFATYRQVNDTEVEPVEVTFLETAREIERIAAKLALAIRRDDDSKHEALAEWDALSNGSVSCPTKEG